MRAGPAMNITKSQRLASSVLEATPDFTSTALTHLLAEAAWWTGPQGLPVAQDRSCAVAAGQTFLAGTPEMVAALFPEDLVAGGVAGGGHNMLIEQPV